MVRMYSIMNDHLKVSTMMIKCCSRSLSILILYLAKMHHANLIAAHSVFQKQV